MKKIILTTLLMLLMCSSLVFAHHGTSAHFDHSKDIVVDGVVSEMKFVNPHSYLYFNALSEDGEVVPWRCELVEVGTLRRAGLDGTVLTPGTFVRVHGKPARREDAVCFLDLIELTDGRNITHRGQISQEEATFVPSEQLKTVKADSAAGSKLVLATGGSEAANRKIVDVPVEGFFGHWADGTRRALVATNNNRGEGGGMGAGMGMGGGMAMAGGRAMGGNNAGRMPGRSQYPAPQYNEAGLAIATRYDPSYDNPALACSASVIFGLSHHGLVNEFVQLDEKTLRLTYGFMDMVRTIHIDGEFPETLTPSTSGYSVGKWEDDTLVVTTKGFSHGVLFGAGGDVGDTNVAINSDQMEIVERFTHDKENDKLNLTWKVTDEGYWTAPLQGEKSLTRSTPYEVYGCEELAGKNNLRESGETLFGDLVSDNNNASVPVAASAAPTASTPVTTLAAATNPEAESSSKTGLILGLLTLALVIGGGLFFRKSASSKE